MRIVIRGLALLAPIAAAALLAAAEQSGVHVRNSTWALFVGGAFFLSWGVLQVTRKKAAPQPGWRTVSTGRRGRR